MESVTAIVFILAVPLVAIAGSILVIVIKTRGQQRLLELAHQERIAAIERGLDLSQLPPLLPTPGQSVMRRAQGMMIGGLLTMGSGFGLCFALLLMKYDDGRQAWPIGFVPIFVGIALMISSRIVRKGVDV